MISIQTVFETVSPVSTLKGLAGVFAYVRYDRMVILVFTPILVYLVSRLLWWAIRKWLNSQK